MLYDCRAGLKDRAPELFNECSRYSQQPFSSPKPGSTRAPPRYVSGLFQLIRQIDSPSRQVPLHPPNPASSRTPLQNHPDLFQLLRQIHSPPRQVLPLRRHVRRPVVQHFLQYYYLII